MSILESARRDWEDGYRRHRRTVEESTTDAAAAVEVQLLLDELRRRVGGTYSLAELAEAYAVAEPWAQSVLAEKATSPTWPRRLADDIDAAFQLFSRGAFDYAP
jgi:hypothetical protein